MRAITRSSVRGMTLLEVVVAAGISAAVMAIAVSVVGSGVRVARQGEQTVSSNTAARTGMEMLLRDLRAAGVAGGYYVTEPGGTPIRINSIFTQAGANGTDELWMVVPRPRALQSDCTAPGSAAVVTTNGTGTLQVNCTGMLNTADTLAVTNLTTGALISGVTFPTATSISYAESGTTNFSSAPQKGGFQRGDLVMPVDIIRYRIRTNTRTNRPEMVRERGALNSPLTAAAPFTVPAGAVEDQFLDVEDLQIAFGTGVAPALTFTSGHAVLYSTPPPMSLRVSVVGISPRPILNDQLRPQTFRPVTVEDHVPGTAIDGYRRSVYRRRVELLNMNPVTL